jgi:3-phosphoshikimate 1-carboxyvinyltransferase
LNESRGFWTGKKTRSVVVFGSKLDGSVTAPPSKSYTHRAIFLASLANGRSKIRNVLVSRDTIATFDACKIFGAKIREMVSNKENIYEVRGRGRVAFTPDVNRYIIDAQNSGTTLRFATALAASASKGRIILTGDESLRRRPMQPLVDCLNQLGANCVSLDEKGCAPILVDCRGLEGGECSIRGDVSSQFVSALILGCTKAKRETTISVEGDLVSKPYIDSTLSILSKFGGEVKNRNYKEFLVKPGEEMIPFDFSIPADSSSCALLISAAILSKRKDERSDGVVRITGIDNTLPQGDFAFIDMVRKIGANVEVGDSCIEVRPTDELSGGEFNLSNTPDLLPPLAVLSIKMKEPLEIIGIEHARYKETNRIAIIAHELSKIGLHTMEMRDGLVIRNPSDGEGSIPKRVKLDAYNDHRLFMAFCALGLGWGKEKGLQVDGLESLDVSYPTFIEDLRRLGAKIEPLDMAFTNLAS